MSPSADWCAIFPPFLHGSMSVVHMSNHNALTLLLPALFSILLSWIFLFLFDFFYSMFFSMGCMEFRNCYTLRAIDA